MFRSICASLSRNNVCKKTQLSSGDLLFNENQKKPKNENRPKFDVRPFCTKPFNYHKWDIVKIHVKEAIWWLSVCTFGICAGTNCFCFKNVNSLSISFAAFSYKVWKVFTSATLADVQIYGNRASLEHIRKFIVLKFLIHGRLVTCNLFSTKYVLFAWEKQLLNAKGRKDFFSKLLLCSSIQNWVTIIAKGIPRNVSS